MSGGSQTVLVTGGAGYVGTHTVVELLAAGYEVVVIDNMMNASMGGIRRVEEISGKRVQCYTIDLLNKSALDKIFTEHKFHNVMHFAGLKAVGESCEEPLLYYRTNLGTTLNLLEVMKKHRVFDLVFSSSCTVFGSPEYLPVDEKHPLGGCTNPYGRSKYFIENILVDICAAEKEWNIISLRYFNPVGAHASGKIGEDPRGIPGNLMPYICQVAVGRRKELSVYGSDYETHDGTAVRDYIHVVDLAQGHVAAIKRLEQKCGCQAYNLGSGVGYSVLDMMKAFEKASGKTIPFRLVDRRAGDVPACYADPTKAEKELGWKAIRDLDKICEDLWRWQSRNPNGFCSQNEK